MFKVLRLEILKNKRRPFWYGLMALLLLEIVWFSISIFRTSIMSNRTFNFDQNYLLFMLMSINGFFAPLFISILSSRIVAIDYDNNMPIVLAVNNQSNSKLYLSKALFGLWIVFIYWLIQCIMVKMISQLLKVSFSGLQVYVTLLLLLISLMAVFVFQLSLSFVIKRQVFSTMVGLIGSFISLMTAGLLPQVVTSFLPILYVSFVNPFKLHGHQILFNHYWVLNGLYVVCITVLILSMTMRFSRRGEIAQ
ncbi:ABC transporter permease [Convivina intestini]|uniref:ABC transporter permease n=1 Tax=Convivina intestini TaxID=1505726 RepID=UPI0020157F6B|nr:ABC transporter permease [Convivina intestini]CAH1852374.1 hypothetical protein R078131_00460 [Convivina intestini]